MHDRVYRICEPAAWAQTQLELQLAPSELDLRDGFVHLSTGSQVAGTLARHFAGRGDLLLLTIACARLTDGELRYEAADDAGAGLRFPHFYGRVPLAAIVSAEPLPLDTSGRHRLPAEILRACEHE